LGETFDHMNVAASVNPLGWFGAVLL
jgi:hypothetical protein